MTAVATRTATDTAATGTATDTAANERVAQPAAHSDLRRALTPLVLDVAVPLGSYYLAHSAFGLNVVDALIVGSVLPAVRTFTGLLGRREWNALATLMLVVNLAGIVLTFATGDARLMLAKDSAISSVIGIGMLCSVALGRPLMSSALKPMLTKGAPAKDLAWDRLAATSPRFRRLERMFTLIWGCCLLADCVARFVGAFILPVTTMTWLGTVILLGAIAVAIGIGGAASEPMQKLVDEAAAAAASTA